MKIGIMTLSETECNYGAVLQHYALQEYLRRKGHDPFLIRYKGTVKGINFRNITPAKVFRFIKRKWSENLVHVQDQPRYFTDFKQMYLVQSELEYINYNDLKNNPPEADMYIVGSDQVWNFYNTPLKYCRNHIHAYFLDFGKEQTEKISYAASWDKRYVTNEQLKEIKPLINKFSYVSVREKSGLELCWKCGIMDAEWIPDPTLLLSSDDYRNIYQDKRNSIRKIKEKFLLIYLVLSKYKSFDLAFIYKYAVDKGLKVIYVTEDKINDSYEKYYPTIPEWLYLVAQAEYVVTNSFHGTVFSLIFHKQFGTIPLVGYSSATNKRIESLYELFHIEDRFIYDEDLSILDKNYKTDFCYPENRFENLLKFSGGGYRQKVLIKACTNGNLGDDLFVRIILERYKSSPIQFFLLVYKIEDYQYLLNEYPKLVLIKYPTPKMLLRILAKLQESLAHSSRLKQYGYEKAYHPLFDEKFDIFINIGGSQFTEYEGESFLLSLYLEELMIRNIKAKTMLLINVNFGPFVTEKYKEKCEAVFKKYSRIIFRDQYSAQLFSKISQVTYIPDIVLGFDFKKRIGEDITQEEMIGINVINLWENKRTYQERKKYIENYEKTIHAVIDYITKLKMKVCIIGFSSEKSEEIYINHIIACAKRRNPFVVIKKCIYNGKNINEVFRCIAECRGLLSTRFHALIIGMALGKCQYPICYDSKLTNFIKSINYTDPYSLLNDISSPEDIADYLIHGNPSDYKHVIDASKEHFTFMDLAIIE